MNKKGTPDEQTDVPSVPHAWNLTQAEAIALQKKLRFLVRLEPLAEPIRYIAGADVSMNLHSDTVYAGFVVLSFPDLLVVDRAAVEAETFFSYVPGLLSFREIPSLVQAWEKLHIKPDVVMVDGVGIAHPRRIGIASHLGVFLDVPTIGCAKSVLTGVYEEPALEAVSISELRDRFRPEEILGAAIRTKDNVKPVFISVGHRLTLPEAVKITFACTKGYRLPEPTRLAHNFVNEERKRRLPTHPTLF